LDFGIECSNNWTVVIVLQILFDFLVGKFMLRSGIWQIIKLDKTIMSRHAIQSLIIPTDTVSRNWRYREYSDRSLCKKAFNWFHVFWRHATWSTNQLSDKCCSTKRPVTFF
jgi:hypothetical protein